MGDSDMRRVMGVLIHGDAAFCGQVDIEKNDSPRVKQKTRDE